MTITIYFSSTTEGQHSIPTTKGANETEDECCKRLIDEKNAWLAKGGLSQDLTQGIQFEFDT